MVLLVDRLSSGWRTSEEIGRELEVDSRKVGRMLQDLLWAGLPLECHRLGQSSARYRLLVDEGRDVRAEQRRCTPSGSIALLFWELRRRAMAKQQMTQLLGCSERAINRYLRAMREAGVKITWSDRTPVGAYRGFRIYRIEVDHQE